MTQLAIDWNEAAFVAELGRLGLSRDAVRLLAAIQKAPHDATWEDGSKWVEASYRKMASLAGLSYYRMKQAWSEGILSGVLEFRDGLEEPHLWRVNLERVFQ